MCFSANVSFLAAGVLSVIGLLSLYISRTRAEKTIACTPLFFAIQQATEGLVWLTLPVGTGLIAYLGVYAYLFFVFIFWPLWMPIAVSFYENEWKRKIAMYCCTAAGGCLALYFLYILLLYGANAQIEGHHIKYAFNAHFTFFEELIGNAFYCVAVLVPLFICSKPRVWYFGAALAASYVITYIFYYAAFTSVWCFFGALLSLLTLYIIYYNQHREKHIHKKH